MKSQKPYTRLPLTEEEFESLRGAASNIRKAALEAWMAATDPKEKAFYLARVAVWDALLAKFQDVSEADTSQDALEGDDEDEGTL
jgi:hypothetical protein